MHDIMDIALIYLHRFLQSSTLPRPIRNTPDLGLFISHVGIRVCLLRIQVPHPRLDLNLISNAGQRALL